MQLDFFNDSQNVSLRNDVILALEHCDATAARPALENLRQHYPTDVALGDLQLLALAVEGRHQTAFQTHAALSTVRQAGYAPAGKNWRSAPPRLAI